MKALIPLAVALLVPAALVYAITRISRWHAGQTDDIDALIAKNAAEPRKGMDSMDWAKSDRAGEGRWQGALRAQRRTRPRDIQPRILPMSGARRRP